MTSNNKIVLVGGSFTNMLLALKLKLDNPLREITIIEKNKELGGLYRTFHYDEINKFDLEVHMYSDTGDQEIDNLVYELLPENQWNVLQGTKRDIAGTYFKGRLQLNTSYVDLRSFPKEKKSRFLGDLFLNINEVTKPYEYSNTEDFLRAKFGNGLFEEIFSPILEKHYKTDAKNLDVMATHIIPFNRVAIYEDEELADLMQAERIRSRIAFPDQHKLPSCYQRDSRILYPNKFGIDQITNALAEKLTKLGVKLFTETNIEKVNIVNKTINGISIETPRGKEELNLDRIFWGAGLLSLSKILNLKQKINFESQKAAFVNLKFDKALKSKDLYYFYVFDSGFSTFRVTNYAAYCPNAADESGFPVCVCVWPEQNATAEEIRETAIRELKAMSVIDDSYKINFSAVEFSNGFPKMTSNNINQMDQLRNNIQELKISNLNTVGLLSKPGLFYLTEILLDAFEQARNLDAGFNRNNKKNLFMKLKRKEVNV